MSNLSGVSLFRTEHTSLYSSCNIQFTLTTSTKTVDFSLCYSQRNETGIVMLLWTIPILNTSYITVPETECKNENIRHSLNTLSCWAPSVHWQGKSTTWSETLHFQPSSLLVTTNQSSHICIVWINIKCLENSLRV
jgi:hypothetical protein